MASSSPKYVVNPNFKFSIPEKQNPLSPDLTDEAWIQLFSRLFGKKNLSIYFSEYEDNHLTIVLSHLIITDIQELEIEYTPHSKVMKYLSFPFFTNLKKLNLGNNKISSMQFFSLIPAPNLQSVKLNENKIQNLRPMHKNRFDKLKSIDFSNNQIHELKGIESLTAIEIILENSDYDKVMAYNIAPLFKLPSNQAKIIKIQGFQRMYQPKVQEQFKKRWSRIWVYKRKQHRY